LDWWVAQQEEIAREPSHVPSLTTPSAVLPECAAQYLSSITDTLSEYFLCRHYDTRVLCLVASARSLGTIFFSLRAYDQREATVSLAAASCLIRSAASEAEKACGYFSTANNWIYTDETQQAGQYKCPMCGTFYRPLASSSSSITPNKVLVSFEVTTSSSDDCLDLQRPLGEVTNPAGSVLFFLCLWPDSATTALHSSFKKIIARVHTEVDSGMSATVMIQKCIDIAVKSGQSMPYFSAHALPVQTMQHIAELNRGGGYSGRKLWHLDHLREPWLAGKCPFKKGDAVLEPETIMQMWVYLDFATKKICAFRQAAL
jgi:hypothetical protein